VASAPKPVDETAAVEGALNNFKSAWNAHDMGRLQAAWAGMQPQQAKALQSFFKDFSNAKVADECPSSSLSISGDSASWACTEITTIFLGGKPQSTPHNIRFTFARRKGIWTIVDRR
jgi:hypothetical protein